MTVSAFLFGTVHTLPVVRSVDAGLLLDGGELGEVLLPTRELDDDSADMAALEVFLYQDGKGLPRASLGRPNAMPGEVAHLQVMDMARVGAFLDWGLPKDLLLPFAEQSGRPEVGRWQLVKVLRDRHGRLFASARLDRHLEDTCDVYSQGDAVPLIVVQRTDLGYKVAVDHRYWGLLQAPPGASPLRPGQRLTGYVQRLRSDRRLSLNLDPPGAAKSDQLSERIYQRL